VYIHHELALQLARDKIELARSQAQRAAARRAASQSLRRSTILSGVEGSLSRLGQRFLNREDREQRRIARRPPLSDVRDRTYARD
jgi:hypothetical protein